MRIYMAGAVVEAEQVCREFCYEVGFCVTVTPTLYVYKGGEEAGFIVGCINYPRFPAHPAEIEGKAWALGHRLMLRLCQSSFTVETPAKTEWFSRREA